MSINWKKAYPNSEDNVGLKLPRDVSKWMKAMREVYLLAQQIGDLEKAFSQITDNWDVMEKLDFKKWMSFYQEDAHNKYKMAFKAPSIIENGHGSYIPNMDELKSNLPFKQPEIYQPTPSAEESEKNKQLEIKKKIQSLVSRLHSAERLATHPDVQLALKKSLDMPLQEWLSLLQQLKREIQLAPLRSTSAKLLEDIVVKNANRAIMNGNVKAGHLLIKVAQIVPLPPTAEGTPPMNPAVAPMGGQPMPPGENKDAVQEFLKNINGDILSADDVEVDDPSEMAHIVVEAQAAPPPAPTPAAPAGPAAPAPRTPAAPAAPAAAPLEEDLAVSEDELQSLEDDKTMDAIDLALENVKLSDIIARLEGIASLFKNRQIARQLSIVDLMMDKLGIAPFFPTLAEAMRSALESNQYCQSRVEEILAKLRGTIESPVSQELEMHQDIDAGPLNPLQQKLQQEEDAETARKEKRRLQKMQEDLAPVEPPPAPLPEAVNAPAEMTGPAQVQTQPNAIRPVG